MSASNSIHCLPVPERYREQAMGRAERDGGDRSTLPSFEARKLPTPEPLPPRAVHVRAVDSEWYPVNPKGPGLLGTACGLPYGGDGGACGFGLDWFGRYADDAEQRTERRRIAPAGRKVRPAGVDKVELEDAE